MKIEAKTRLQALTEKQKQLDIDGDGQIDGEDLEKVREGKTPVTAVGIRGFQAFLKSLGLDPAQFSAPNRLSKGTWSATSKSANASYTELTMAVDKAVKVITKKLGRAKELGGGNSMVWKVPGKGTVSLTMDGYLTIQDPSLDK